MRTKLLVSALCFLTLGVFALPADVGHRRNSAAPAAPSGNCCAETIRNAFDPDSGEEDSEESSADDESSAAPTEPERWSQHSGERTRPRVRLRRLAATNFFET